MERRGRMQHQPALDGLRGAAVAGVLLFHAGHLRGGYLGVDAFFVLSGFLITSLLLAEGARTGTVALGAFWARRARRLLPALLAVLAFVAVYSLVVASAAERTTIRGDGLATLGYFANWRAIFSGTDYWALFGSPSPLEHTWSLAIEEQFYLVWPLLLVAITAAPRRVLALAGGLAIASFVWMQVLYDPASPSRVYFGTDTRLASILIGAALAAWVALTGTRGARSPASNPRSRGVEFGRAPRVRVAAPRRFLHGALPRRAVPHRARGGVCDRRRRAPAARRYQPRALVRSAVRARTHQLRRLPVALADLRVARRATHAPRRLGARRAAHLDHDRGRDALLLPARTADPPRRDPRSGAATRGSRARRPARCRPRVRDRVVVTRRARRRGPDTRRDSAARSRASVGGRELRSRCSSPTRASRRCPRTRASTC